MPSPTWPATAYHDCPRPFHHHNRRDTAHSRLGHLRARHRHLQSSAFSEPLGSNIVYSGIELAGENGNVTLGDVSTKNHSDDTITATLNATQRTTVGDTMTLSVSEGAVADPSDNDIRPDHHSRRHGRRHPAHPGIILLQYGHRHLQSSPSASRSTGPSTTTACIFGTPAGPPVAWLSTGIANIDTWTVDLIHGDHDR